MKKTILLITLSFGLVATVCSGQTREFYRSVLEDPDKSGSRKLVGLNVKIGEFDGRAIIQNGEFAYYLQKNHGVSRDSYVAYTTDFLVGNKTLIVCNDRPESSLFTTIIKIKRVESTSELGLARFISFYFDDGMFRADINHDSLSTSEMYAVADQLFKNGVVTYDAGPTGLIKLWNYKDGTNK